MIDFVRTQTPAGFEYGAYENGEQVGFMLWRKSGTNAEIHDACKSRKKTHLVQFRDYFNTVIRNDMKANGISTIVAVCPQDNAHKALVHWWRWMGFKYFSAVQEV